MEAIVNKKARFNYAIIDKMEAGIVLEGWEIKPILNRNMNLDLSYVIVKDGELFLLNSIVIPEITASTHVVANQSRTRKLLMKKAEIMKLIGKINEKGLTLVPTRVYRKGRNIKVEIALVKGKNEFDKRQTIKDRDVKLNLASIMKNSTKNK